MGLTRWDPGSLMSDLLEEMGSPFGDRQRTRPFEADVVELEDEILVTAELPGVNREDLDLTVENGVLTIRGEKKEEKERAERDGRYHLTERRWGRFTRSFALPRAVDTDEVRATFSDGILRVRIPKAQDSRRRRISISGGDSQKRLSESAG